MSRLNQKLSNKHNSVMSSKIKMLRKAYDIPLQEMADLLGITSAPNYVLYEKGKSRFRYDMLLKIAKKFNISVDFLVDDTQEIQIDDLIKTQKINIKLNEKNNSIINLLKATENLQDDEISAINQINKSLLTLIEVKKNPKNQLNISDYLTKNTNQKLQKTLKSLTKKDQKTLNKLVEDFCDSL